MNPKSTRRAFFATGAAVVGAGVATGVTAAGLRPQDPVPSPGAAASEAADREAIRALQAMFARAIEGEAWDDAAALFDESATLEIGPVGAVGRGAIRDALATHAMGEAARHRAYRANASLGERIEVREREADATFGVDVRIEAPLRADCTAAMMAREQGLLADLRWDSGHLEASYARRSGGWKLTSLRYRSLSSP